MKRVRSDDASTSTSTTTTSTSNTSYTSTMLPEIVSMSSLATKTTTTTTTTTNDENDNCGGNLLLVDLETSTACPSSTSIGTCKKKQKQCLSSSPPPSLMTPTRIDYDDDGENDHDENDKNDIPSACQSSTTTTTTENSALSLQQQQQQQQSSSSSPSSSSPVTIAFESAWQHVSKRRHQECPQRITSIHNALEQAGLLSQCHVMMDRKNDNKSRRDDENDDDSSNECFELTREDYDRVHYPGYMARLESYGSSSFPKNKSKQQQQQQQQQHQDWLDEEARQYTSIYLTPQSTMEAKQAASTLCHLVKHVVTQQQQHKQQQHKQQQQQQESYPTSCGFAMIRPPGHHAESGMAGGFCLLNNIALAASYAKHKLFKRKILIVDIDIHHGNGTQRAFADDPNILYFSIHGRYLFPHHTTMTTSSSANNNNNNNNNNNSPKYTGTGPGQGYTVNVAWTDCTSIGDDEYYAVWQHLLLPILKEFEPDLVLISAGFDAAEGDVGGCHVTPECFGNLTRLLLQEVDNNNNDTDDNNKSTTPVVAALEGGYVPSTLGRCVVNVIQAMLLSSSLSSSQSATTTKRRTITLEPMSLEEDIDPMAAGNIRETMTAHAPYWKCLRQQEN